MSQLGRRDGSIFGVRQGTNYCRTNTRILFVSQSSNTKQTSKRCQCLPLSWPTESPFQSCEPLTANVLVRFLSGPLALIWTLFGKVPCGDADEAVSSKAECIASAGILPAAGLLTRRWTWGETWALHAGEMTRSDCLHQGRRGGASVRQSRKSLVQSLLVLNQQCKDLYKTGVGLLNHPVPTGKYEIIPVTNISSSLPLPCKYQNRPP